MLNAEDKDPILKYSEFRQIALFEYYAMPLKRMSLNDYERRLKKLAYVPEDS